MIRPATPADVDDLAHIHVQAWRETYTGLVPQAQIDSRTHAVRRAQWAAMIDAGQSRIALAPGLGFAQMGPQRDRTQPDHPEELYALYLLKQGQGQGLGRALLAAVTGTHPFTALVLDGNAPALGFYRHLGAKVLTTRPFSEDGFTGTEHLLSFAGPPASLG